MMTNNTYKEIALKLHGYDKVLIFPHVNMDGDCLGSSAALCHVLRGFGKEAYVLADDVTPRNLDFLEIMMYLMNMTLLFLWTVEAEVG